MTEAQVSPRQISILLDQSIRELMVLIDPERLHPLGAIFDFQSLHDLATDVEGFDVSTQRVSLFKIRGENGMFWPDGIYDDQNGFSWPENQVVKPEIFRLATVNWQCTYGSSLMEILLLHCKVFNGRCRYRDANHSRSVGCRCMCNSGVIPQLRRYHRGG